MPQKSGYFCKLHFSFCFINHFFISFNNRRKTYSFFIHTIKIFCISSDSYITSFRKNTIPWFCCPFLYTIRKSMFPSNSSEAISKICFSIFHKRYQTPCFPPFLTSSFLMFASTLDTYTCLGIPMRYPCRS